MDVINIIVLGRIIGRQSRQTLGPREIQTERQTQRDTETDRKTDGRTDEHTDGKVVERRRGVYVKGIDYQVINYKRVTLFPNVLKLSEK